MRLFWRVRFFLELSDSEIYHCAVTVRFSWKITLPKTNIAIVIVKTVELL